jgi:hypothetical protein
MDQVAHLQGLDVATETRRDNIIGQLNQEHIMKRNTLESSLDLQTGKTEVIIASVMPLVSSIHAHPHLQPSAGLHSLTITQSTPHVTSCLPSHSLKFINDQPTVPIPQINQVWLNFPQVELGHLAEAMSELEPSIPQVKTEDDGTFASEYEGRLQKCLCRMHIGSPGEGPSLEASINYMGRTLSIDGGKQEEQ